ncbi:MAG: hypothetical protein JNL08_08225 [Planctomycetes bacterium]|nr:hypothetical protein [Planctomycetota bacterium]
MPSPTSHPDRAAATLANVADERQQRGAGPFAPPGAGAADCRIDVKLLLHAAERAAARSPRARERLAALELPLRPDLRAGTVRDGTAHGLAAALEEVVALAPAPPPPAAPDDPTARIWTGRELRKKKDLLVASGGPRVRFSRREGLLYVDRDAAVHSANCLRFEARRDHGSLDAFAGCDGERPRLHSAQFLQPQRYVEAGPRTTLLLAGRLGRGAIGWPCELELVGDTREPGLDLVLRVDHRHAGWRLRARFLGVPADAIRHDCTPVTEVVQNDAGGFVAVTLVRGCTTLLVDGAPVAVPGAACLGRVEHRFRLGGTAGPRLDTGARPG